jgi:hypothetical protein
MRDPMTVNTFFNLLSSDGKLTEPYFWFCQVVG